RICFVKRTAEAVSFKEAEAWVPGFSAALFEGSISYRVIPGLTPGATCCRAFGATRLSLLPFSPLPQFPLKSDRQKCLSYFIFSRQMLRP
ncbi:MAG TPA: hypothetical protein VK747_06905, partial [Blastocatellia bacterium]|nr:hypothetical protein [Blastocatellia bacterium]